MIVRGIRSDDRCRGGIEEILSRPLCTERTAFPDPPDVHGPAIKYYSSRTPYIALLGFLDHHESRLGHASIYVQISPKST
jgi:hypothetical protein